MSGQSKRPQYPRTEQERRALHSAGRILTRAVPLLLDLANGWRADTWADRAREMLADLHIPSSPNADTRKMRESADNMNPRSVATQTGTEE